MQRKISKRFFLGGALAAWAGGALAKPPETSLRPVLRGAGFHRRAIPSAEGIVAGAKLGGRVCFAVADAASGKMLEGSNSKTGAPPASVTKAITALYALESLGASHRFATRLIATGPVEGGVLKGDLVLAGGGDPTLDTDALAALAQLLKAGGVREVRGNFVVYDGAFPRTRTIDKDQPDHVGYSPAISGIALNFNRVHFEWRRGSGGYAVTMDARTKRYRPDVFMARMRVADRSLPVYEYRDANGRDNWTVARGALGKGGARWLPVRKPGLYAGDVFQTMARSQGIVLKNPKVQANLPRGSEIARHQSAPLREILRDMLKFSTNITAEMVGLGATVARGGKPSSLRASAKSMSLWAEKRFGAKGISLVDHSGLGDASKMTPEAMVTALVKVRQSNQLKPILKEFAMRDAKRRVIKNHPLKVAAKTGTLNFVSGLAGYVTLPDGRDLAFAIFAADEATRGRIRKADREAPQGARSWNRRAKAMQQKLIERWAAFYGSS